MRTISFSLSDEEYQITKFEAKAKGLTPSQYAKSAMFSHTNKYASKGVFTELYRILGVEAPGSKKPTFVESGGEKT